MKTNHFALTLFFIASSFASPSFAQNMDNDANSARVERLEKDIMLLQRQLARSGAGAAASGSGGVATTGSADFEVRLSSIEEQMREILGRTEEVDFQVKKLSQNLEKMQKDTDFRFGELSPHPTTTQGQLSANTPATANTLTQDAAAKQRKVPDENLKVIEQDKTKKLEAKPDETADAPDSDGTGALETNFATPRDHYNYAFRLLNQTQYDKAAESFAGFIKKHPKDPLVGNAYYWQGETFYIRRDYVKAADSFRQGFEEMPTGAKAPDNLLKLAMTLNALQRSKEACVVLTQVVAKFKTTSAAVAQKAEQEQKRIDCK